VTLEDVRAAAIDRALAGDDAASALALAGVVGVARRATNEQSVARRARSSRQQADGPLTAAMLAVCAVTAADGQSLDDRAWRPGTEADPFVVAGAAAAVRTRNVAVDHAADLADCAPAALETVVERQRRREKGA